MNIDIHAFQNCISLKEIRFNKMAEPVFIDVLKDDNLPDDYKIIVPDDMYKATKELYHPIFRRHVCSFTTDKQDKLRKQTKDIDIYLAICHLKKVKDIEQIDTLIEYLMQTYSIDASVLQKVSETFKV